MMKALLFAALLLGNMLVRAQPGDPSFFCRSCILPPADSVDINRDGIADLVVHGAAGESTCDIPVSFGSCAVHVTTLPGTYLLSVLHPMGSRVVQGFAHGDTLSFLNTGQEDDLRIPRYAFMEGSVRVLYWTYGRSGSGTPIPTPESQRIYVYATTTDHEIVRGTFTIVPVLEKRTVRVQLGDPITSDKPFVLP